MKKESKILKFNIFNKKSSKKNFLLHTVFFSVFAFLFFIKSPALEAKIFVKGDAFIFSQDESFNRNVVVDSIHIEKKHTVKTSSKKIKKEKISIAKKKSKTKKAINVTSVLYGFYKNTAPTDNILISFYFSNPIINYRTPQKKLKYTSFYSSTNEQITIYPIKKKSSYSYQLEIYNSYTSRLSSSRAPPALL